MIPDTAQISLSSPPASGSAGLAAAAGHGQLRRLVVMRAFAVAGELGAAVLAGPLLDIQVTLTPLLLVIGLLAAFNAYTWWRLRDPVPVGEAELFAQIGVDLLALTVLLFFSGGAANPFVSLYLPYVAVAAALLPPRLAWAVAGLSVAAYSGLGVASMPLAVADAQRAATLHLAGMWVIFVASAALITAFVARMTAAIRSRDRQLAAAREEALRNEGVVALGGLAAGAAHELGTPLATMTVLAGELVRDPSLPAAVREDLDLIVAQLGHCKEIITGLAQRAGQARAEGGGAVALDVWLGGIVARWQRLRPQAQARVRLEGPQPAPRVLGEATLAQGFTNLFNNAADVCAEPAEILARWDGARLHLEVADRGPGWNAQALLAAGRSFFSTRPGGAGIGLFLAHAAIERFGGRLQLENRPGGGAVARVELPLERLRAEMP